MSTQDAMDQAYAVDIQSEPDFIAFRWNRHSIVVVEPMNELATQWMDENLHVDVWQVLHNGAVCIDVRYLFGVETEMMEAGFNVQVVQ